MSQRTWSRSGASRTVPRTPMETSRTVLMARTSRTDPITLIAAESRPTRVSTAKTVATVDIAATLIGPCGLISRRCQNRAAVWQMRLVASRNADHHGGLTRSEW